ncbi:MAG: toll/interleukin-1 receptor domain-containing protein [Myxococcaceae bacterium]|nr:toll/interleukin-1 receptor domain-containing protein [Myxococcaceae bacterium]MCA3016653.1 toll/interleukin-1 receptor domain-containing protein [Myxococcaceae bacterium]
MRVLLSASYTGLCFTHTKSRRAQIFIPPFFPRVGGLSIASAGDTVIVDAVAADFALAGWLARRLTLQGYRVWSAVTAPLAGESESDTINALISTRAAKVVSVLSNAALRDADAVARRGQAAQASLLIPATAEVIDWTVLDSKSKALSPARFEVSLAEGLRVVLQQLEHAGVPRGPETAVLDHRVFAAADSLRREPEKLHSNQFAVLIAPTRALRFRASDRAVGQAWPDVELQWGFRREGRSFLALVEPPSALVEQLGLRPDGSAQFSEAKIDNVRSRDLLVELLTKTLRALAVSRGLSWCHQKRELHFPQTEAVERLSFVLPGGKGTHVKAWGERSFWRPGASTRYRYALAPELGFASFGDSDLRMTVRVHVRISDDNGKLEKDTIAFSRRKRLSASWYNDEWFKRLLAVAQFLAGGASTIDVLSGTESVVRIGVAPLAYDAPFGVNEEQLKDFAALRQEAIEMQLDDQDGDEAAEEEVADNA